MEETTESVKIAIVDKSLKFLNDNEMSILRQIIIEAPSGGNRISIPYLFWIDRRSIDCKFVFNIKSGFCEEIKTLIVSGSHTDEFNFELKRVNGVYVWAWQE